MMGKTTIKEIESKWRNFWFWFWLSSWLFPWWHVRTSPKRVETHFLSRRKQDRMKNNSDRKGLQLCTFTSSQKGAKGHLESSLRATGVLLSAYLPVNWGGWAGRNFRSLPFQTCHESVSRGIYSSTSYTPPEGKYTRWPPFYQAFPSVISQRRLNFTINSNDFQSRISSLPTPPVNLLSMQIFWPLLRPNE